MVPELMRLRQVGTNTIRAGFSGSRGGAAPWRSRRFQKLFLTVDQRVDIVWRQLEAVTVRDGVRGARLYAVAAKNTTRIIYVVDTGVPLSSRNALRLPVFSRFDIDAICRAGRGTQETAHTFL